LSTNVSRVVTDKVQHSGARDWSNDAKAAIANSMVWHHCLSSLPFCADRWHLKTIFYTY